MGAEWCRERRSVCVCCRMLEITYMSDQLINGRAIDSVAVFNNRVFQGHVDLCGQYFVSSDDELPVPMYVVYELYRQMHYRAVCLLEGKAPESDQPDVQIVKRIIEDDESNDTVGKTISRNILVGKLTGSVASLDFQCDTSGSEKDE